MADLSYEIRPICLDEWLPDGCMGYGEAIDPATDSPGSGCDSLQPYTQGDRDRLIGMYRQVLEQHGCCGFVAWIGDRIAGYNNFFPREWADRIRFYGSGTAEDRSPDTLVHNCISIKANTKYRRRGIGSSLIRRSLGWGRDNGWDRFEVHLVTEDSPEGFAGEQKSCRTFWEKLGFQVFRKDCHGTFSLAVDLSRWAR